MSVRQSFLKLFSTFLIIWTPASFVFAEMLYVDSQNGDDANPATQEKPLRTIGKAAAIVNSDAKTGPTTIKIGPGIYNLTNSVTFENSHQYTEKDRLIIEASILPDDPQWRPSLLPIILSTKNPGISEIPTATYSLKVKRSYVTQTDCFLGEKLHNYNQHKKLHYRSV